MFGTMGFSELIIILIIILIIFGTGRLPQIGEGVGKALKGFRKEINEAPQSVEAPSTGTTTNTSSAAKSSSSIAKANIPYVPGPELTPGTTASLLYNTSQNTPQASTTHPNPVPTSFSSQVISMEERTATPPPTAPASYPPLPATSQAKAAAKRPSAIVNKDAVARVQAQQAALKATATPSTVGISPDNLQNLGEGLGDVVRTFRQAVSDVRDSVDPHMQTIQAEIDAAEKELQQSLEAETERPPAQGESPKSA